MLSGQVAENHFLLSGRGGAGKGRPGHHAGLGGGGLPQREARQGGRRIKQDGGLVAAAMDRGGAVQLLKAETASAKAGACTTSHYTSEQNTVFAHSEALNMRVCCLLNSQGWPGFVSRLLQFCDTCAYQYSTPVPLPNFTLFL